MGMEWGGSILGGLEARGAAVGRLSWSLVERPVTWAQVFRMPGPMTWPPVKVCSICLPPDLSPGPSPFEPFETHSSHTWPVHVPAHTRRVGKAVNQKLRLAAFLRVQVCSIHVPHPGVSCCCLMLQLLCCALCSVFTAHDVQSTGGPLSGMDIQFHGASCCVQVGEGLEAQKADFAAEVEAIVKGN